jgi:outer membrane protein TolC
MNGRRREWTGWLGGLAMACGVGPGCAQPGIEFSSRPGVPGASHGAHRIATNPLDAQVTRTGLETPPALTQAEEATRELPGTALPVLPAASAGNAGGGPVVPLGACIQRALAANPTVRAARWNVEALKQRIPQVTALDDPVVSNTIYPVTSVAPQYSLMGYMPYSALLAQQFPWFGTLRLRGEAASHDVRVALLELGDAQLEVVEGVKRAYADLQFAARSEALLRENRRLTEDFLEVARERYRTGGATQADVVRAEVAVSDIDRELEATGQAVVEARAELARLMHAGPESPLQAEAPGGISPLPAELGRLYQLAVVSRPDLQGRLAVIARDQAAIELAELRKKPNVTLGLAYSAMSERGAVVGQAADGMPNVGLFVGFNLPVYRGKLNAAVCEARARKAADAALYEAERDDAQRDIQGLFAQARTLRNVGELLRRTNRPAASQVLELAAGAYRAGAEGGDFLSVLAASRDVLQVELQIAQVEAELAKALASLERAVGGQLNQSPVAASTLVPPAPAELTEPPPATGAPGPFQKPPGAEATPPRPPETRPGGPTRGRAAKLGEPRGSVR